MSRYFAFLASIWLSLFSLHVHGQTAAPDTVRRVVLLPDVEIKAKIGRLVVATGTENNKTWHVEAPGGGYAVRFLAPQGGYHELRQIRLHLSRPGQIKEGQVRVRVVAVGADQAPTNNDLLPEPVLLSTETLRNSRRHLTLQWPGAHLVVPEAGFFIVVEGLGRTPDEYVSKLEHNSQKPGPPVYQLSLRTQPGVPVRSADSQAFPLLKGTEATSETAESWYRDTVTQQWRRSRPGQSVVLLEAVFE